MSVKILMTLLLAFFGAATAFQCSPDTILRMATDKRSKQLERECHLEQTGEPPCATRNDLETAWKDFIKLTDQYKEAVTKCREQAARPKRRSPGKQYRKRHTIYHNEDNVSEKVRPESEQFDAMHPIRTRRQVCKTKSSQDLNQLKEDFVEHCERDNICLPDEDLPNKQQRDRFKELHAARAKKYSAYLTQLSLCYGRLG